VSHVWLKPYDMFLLAKSSKFDNRTPVIYLCRKLELQQNRQPKAPIPDEGRGGQIHDTDKLEQWRDKRPKNPAYDETEDKHINISKTDRPRIEGPTAPPPDSHTTCTVGKK
jgi:hypothetical protein